MSEYSTLRRMSILFSACCGLDILNTCVTAPALFAGIVVADGAFTCVRAWVSVSESEREREGERERGRGREGEGERGRESQGGREGGRERERVSLCARARRVEGRVLMPHACKLGMHAPSRKREKQRQREREACGPGAWGAWVQILGFRVLGLAFRV